MFHEQYSCTDINGVGEVVGTYDYRCSCRAVVVLDDTLQVVLARWVEEVEWLVENENLWCCHKCGDNAHFLFVACREVSYENLASEDLASREMFETLCNGVDIVVFHARNLIHETEVFLRGEKVYEETIVDESAGEVFPVFALVNTYSF